MEQYFRHNRNLGPAFYIKQQNGNTGIGTAYPQAKLDVNGNTYVRGKMGVGIYPPPGSNYKLYVDGGIKAREIKVTIQSFSDYVFSDGYSKLSIHELDSFIKEHKHLPGMPSCADIEKDEGFELGAIQIKLLEKVEEQALYIISLQKQIDELKSMITKPKEDQK